MVVLELRGTSARRMRRACVWEGSRCETSSQAPGSSAAVWGLLGIKKKKRIKKKKKEENTLNLLFK